MEATRREFISTGGAAAVLAGCATANGAVAGDDVKYIDIQCVITGGETMGVAPLEEMTEEVFLPFYTTKQSGTGIGLCLSRQIMRMHGGDLKLNSHYGQGATFMVTL